MPVIKIWCLPKLSQLKLEKIFKSIIKAVENVPELNLRGEKSMTILFPTDAMKYGLGTEIIIEVTSLVEKPERTMEVRKHLATNLGNTIKGIFPKAMVECFIFSFNLEQGFWTSQSAEKPVEPPKAPVSVRGWKVWRTFIGSEAPKDVPKNHLWSYLMTHDNGDPFAWHTIACSGQIKVEFGYHPDSPFEAETARREMPKTWYAIYCRK